MTRRPSGTERRRSRSSRCGRSPSYRGGLGAQTRMGAPAPTACSHGRRRRKTFGPPRPLFRVEIADAREYDALVLDASASISPCAFAAPIDKPGGNVMDPARFDRLVHALSSSRTRRRALGAALASALLSAAASAAPEPANCLAIGKRCRQAADARHVKSKRNGKHHPPACAKCCSRFGAAGSDGKARCSCKPEGEACDDASQCCGGRCRDGNCTGCAAGTKPCQGACIPETSCCAADADGAPCGVGGQCDDGRCFLAYPNCEGTCSTFGVAAGSGGVNFCNSGSDDQPCNGLACNATADCPAGQWCEVLAACGNHCVDGCPA